MKKKKISKLNWMMYFNECIKKLYPSKEEQDKILNRHEQKLQCSVFVWVLEKFINDNFPNRFDQDPDEDFLSNFQKWVEQYFKTVNQKQKLLQNLIILEAHSKFATCVDELSFDISPYLDIYKIVQQTKRIKKKVFTNHVQELLKICPDDDKNLNDFQALMYCSATSKMTDVRFLILEQMKFKGNLQLLKQNLEKRQTIVPNRYKELIVNETKPIPIIHYLQLLNVLNLVDHTNLKTLSKECILQYLQNGIINNHSAVYWFLKKELTDMEIISFLQQGLDFSFTKLTRWDKLRLLSNWHQQILDQIIKNMKQCSKTSYEHQYEMTLKIHIATYINFIMENYDLKWFFDHSNEINFEDLIIKYVQSRKVENQKVKSSIESHSAHQPVCDFYHFLKIGLQHLIVFPITLNQAKLVNSLENQRIAADPSKTRTFTDDEINAMFEVVKNNKAHTLMLTILREIGLRISSLLHLQVKDVMDEYGEPKKLCKVKEKKQTIREFIPSTNLQNKCKDYIQTLNIPDDNQDIYLFYPDKIASRHTISELFKRIALQAGITTNVHIHAFRHTLVSKLIESGNSIEVVSKYLGHAQSKTTEHFYYKPTITQLTEKMQNPFDENFYKKRSLEEETKLDLELVETKKQKLMELVFVYNNIIANNAKQNKSAKDIQKELFSKIPQLGTILQDLE